MTAGIMQKRRGLLEGRAILLAVVGLAFSLGIGADGWSQSSRSGQTASSATRPWMQGARAAEALLQEEGGADAALEAYQRLLDQFPNQLPLLLRTAQVADLADKTGLALFYYRLYLTRAGDQARSEARERAGSLELDPGARAEADGLARERKTQVRAAQTPATQVSTALMAALGEDDSSLIEIRDENMAKALQDPQELARLAAEVRAKPRATASTQEDEALVRSFASRAGTANTARPIVTPQVSETGNRRALNRVTVREGDFHRESPATTGSGFDDSGAVEQQPDFAPLGTQASPQETAGRGQAMQGFEQDTSWGQDLPPVDFNQAGDPRFPLGYQDSPNQVQRQQAPALPRVEERRPERPRAQGRVQISDVDEQQPVSARGPRDSESFTRGNWPDEDELDRPSRPQAPAGEGPRMATAIDPRQRFFTTRPSQDGRTRLRLANNLPDSVMTFSALPESGSGKADAILATGESRNLDISPGAFEIRITVMTLGYPPATISDRRFRMRMNAGTEYSVRLTQEVLQRVN